MRQPGRLQRRFQTDSIRLLDDFHTSYEIVFLSRHPLRSTDEFFVKTILMFFTAFPLWKQIDRMVISSLLLVLSLRYL
jgi:hypothetical protein